jgi:RNA polymerase sigma factor for flagellar operon FliA
VTEIRRLDAHSRRFYTVSLDETANPSGTGDSVRLGDLVPDDASPDPLELITEGDNRSLLVKAIESLNVKDRLVLSLYYQEGLTLKEISKILEVTESRVCQVHSKILSKLKDRLKELKWEY